MTGALPDLQGRPVAATDQQAFLRIYGALFEHSPWVVVRAWAHRPFADAVALDMAFKSVIAAARPDEQLALARAHPELADRLKLRSGELTPNSAAEQASAGLESLTPVQFETFQTLNAAYRARFGFPFIICVRLHDLAGIEAAMRARLLHDADEELREAMRQVGLIGTLRLGGLALPIGAAAHDEAVRRDLELLAFPKPWMPRENDAEGRQILDVAVIGGGQCGLAAAFGLRREGIEHLLVLDENSEGEEGPWTTYARMITLRTPKDLTPIDFGLPNLTFRAWWEARHGIASWQELEKIPRQDWMAYLRWYRAVLGLPVRNDARVTLVEPLDQGLFRVHLDAGDTLTARKVVLATGIQGGGAWAVPDFVTQSLPTSVYAHTSQKIDFEKLRGARIGILGGGASAFDNAQHALAAGVATVDVFIRRKELPQVNPIRYLERSGILRHFVTLDDARKYRVIDHFLRHSQPPTNDTFNRAAAQPGFSLHLGEGWDRVEAGADGSVRVITHAGHYDFDFLILSTGLRNDPALRPELALVRNDIALWRDRYTPPAGTGNAQLDEHPYLGGGFELTSRHTEKAASLHGLFVFNYSALASLGLSASALSGLKPALPRLVAAVTGQLFADRQDELLAAYEAYQDKEFEGIWPLV